jgi:hypothetical protein
LHPILAAYFSEPLLRSLGLAIPFQAEYEGSIPFTRSMNRFGSPALDLAVKHAAACAGVVSAKG